MASGKAEQITFAAGEPGFRAARLRSAKACNLYNQQPEDASVDERTALWWNIVTTDPPDLHEKPISNDDSQQHSSSNTPFATGAPYVKTPIHIDYGTNLHIGPETFINRGCKILDTPVLPVRIGARCLIGPDVHIYAVGHSLDHRERTGPGAPSVATEVEVGEDCWIGGRVSILAGVKIGRRCVIGCGSVVTKDVPPGHLAVGNPARVIRKIDDHAPDTMSPPEPSNACERRNNNNSIATTSYDWLDEHHHFIEAAFLLICSFLAKGMVALCVAAALWRLAGFMLARGGNSGGSAGSSTRAAGPDSGIVRLELKLYAFAARLVEWMASQLRRP